MPLLTAFSSREEDDLREEMRQLLSSLKLSAAEALFLESLKDRELAHVHADILGFLWSCGFTCENHLALIAEVACQGDFRQAMEGCTLIEQVSPFKMKKTSLKRKSSSLRYFKTGTRSPFGRLQSPCQPISLSCRTPWLGNHQISSTCRFSMRQGAWTGANMTIGALLNDRVEGDCGRGLVEV